jgi:hypothetical protein
MARSLLKTRGLPAAFWEEAVTTAVYLLNRAPTKSVAGKTPFEAWHGRRPDVEHLRVFGCIAYVRVTRPHLKKLEDRGVAMVFISYEPGAKAWRFFDPVAQRVHVSRDAVFQENESWDWSKVYSSGDHNSEFVIEIATEEVLSSPDVSYPSLGDGTHTSPLVGAPTPTPALTQGVVGAAPSPAFVSPPPDAYEHLDFGNDVTPRFRVMDNVLGPATPPGPIPREFEDELHLQIGEPRTRRRHSTSHGAERCRRRWIRSSTTAPGDWRLCLQAIEQLASNGCTR